MFQQIDTLFLLEQFFNIPRFNVNGINNLDIETTKVFLLSIVDKLGTVFHNNEWKIKTVNKLKIRINKFNSVNHIQKFIADCYNHILIDAVSVTHKIIRNNNNAKITTYIFN